MNKVLLKQTTMEILFYYMQLLATTINHINKVTLKRLIFFILNFKIADVLVILFRI